MKKINSVLELRQEIALLELKQISDRLAIKEQFNITRESLRPVNLIKKALNELITVPELKGNILNSALGVGAGYLTKKAVTGSSHNPFKQLFGTLLQVGITNLVSKNGEGIKSGAIKLISHLLSKRS